MAEVDDRELALLRNAHGILDKMYRKNRRETEKLMKAVEPNVTTTEDLAAPYVEQVSSLEKKFDTFVETFNNERVDNKLNEEYGRLRADGWTDDGIEKLKKLQVERRIPSPVDAAAVWEKLNPPPTPQIPSTFSPQGWGIGGKTEDADLKLLFSDEDAWAEREAQKAWDEATN